MSWLQYHGYQIDKQKVTNKQMKNRLSRYGPYEEQPKCKRQFQMALAA
jgi:hypothetical protein